MSKEDAELEKIKHTKMKEMLGSSSLVHAKNVPIDVTDKDFDGMISDSSLAVVDFWADWCAPCKVMHPVIEKLAAKFAGKVTFAELNVDENQEVASRFGVFSIPTFIIFKDGQVVDQVVGAVGEAGLEKVIARHT